MQKKKLSVIRPTLRHKKRYILIKLLDTAINFDSKKIYSVLTQALLKNSGLFVQVDTNITILEADVVSKTLLIRINKDYLNEFISSLFFAQAELGLLKIVETTSTIKKIKVAPIGIKAISAYYVIINIINLIFGLIILLFPKKINNYLLSLVVELSEINPEVLGAIIAIMGISFIIFGLLGIFIGVSLYRLKSWARWLIIIFSLFSFSYSFLGLLTGNFSVIVGFLINGAIAWYLIFDEQVKIKFKGK